MDVIMCSTFFFFLLWYCEIKSIANNCSVANLIKSLQDCCAFILSAFDEQNMNGSFYLKCGGSSKTVLSCFGGGFCFVFFKSTTAVFSEAVGQWKREHFLLNKIKQRSLFISFMFKNQYLMYWFLTRPLPKQAPSGIHAGRVLRQSVWDRGQTVQDNRGHWVGCLFLLMASVICAFHLIHPRWGFFCVCLTVFRLLWNTTWVSTITSRHSDARWRASTQRWWRSWAPGLLRGSSPAWRSATSPSPASPWGFTSRQPEGRVTWGEAWCISTEVAGPLAVAVRIFLYIYLQHLGSFSNRHKSVRKGLFLYIKKNMLDLENIVHSFLRDGCIR